MKVLRVAAPLLLTGVAAEAGVRLLRPPAGIHPPPPAEVPAVGEHFSAEEVRRGRRYGRGQLALGLTGSLIDVAVLAALTRRARVRATGSGEPRFGAGSGAEGPIAGAAAGAGLAAGLAAAGLPIAALARRRALAVGLATQSWAAWAQDVGKAVALRGAFAAAAGGAVVAVSGRRPTGWWLPVAAASVGAGAAVAALAPVVLDPIFNRFEPLPPGEARSDVLALAARSGVEVGEVYTVDASRRSTAANAYVSGLGPTKRIVLFDTLLDRYTRDELRLVVAHELAHVAHRDVPRGLAFAAILAGPVAFAAERLTRELTGRPGIGPGELPALALAAGIVSGPAGIVGNRLVRAMERAADAAAIRLAGHPEAFVAFERRITLQNVADPDPPRWLAALLATHPPTLERIGAALAVAGAPAA